MIIWLCLLEPDYATLLKKYRHILDNRNALLASGRFDEESYHLWTDQLLRTSHQIQKARKQALQDLEKEAQELIRKLSGLLALKPR